MWTVEEKEEKYGAGAAFLSFLAFVWVVLGIAAFIVSLMCFGRSGSDTHKILGILLAILFGPFYWVYFISNKKYCRK